MNPDELINTEPELTDEELIAYLSGVESDTIDDVVPQQEQIVDPQSSPSSEDLALLEAASAAGAESIPPTASLNENQEVAAQPAALAADPALTGMLQQLAMSQQGIQQALAQQAQTQAQSNELLRNMVNPPQEPSPEDIALDARLAPILQQNMQMQERLSRVEQEKQEAQRKEFEASQKAAITEVKTIYPDFDAKYVAENFMAPMAQDLINEGVPQEAAEFMVMKLMGRPDRLAAIWKANKFDTIMSKAKKPKPDPHVATGSTPVAPASIMEDIMSEDEAKQTKAINSLYKTYGI